MGRWTRSATTLACVTGLVLASCEAAPPDTGTVASHSPPAVTPVAASASPDLAGARLAYPPDVTSRVLDGRTAAPAGVDACVRGAIGEERLARLRSGAEPVSGRDNDSAALCLVRAKVPPASLSAPPGGPGAGSAPPETGRVSVEFVRSSYPIARPGARTGTFRTGQPADLMLSGLDFDDSGGPLLFNHPSGLATDGRRLIVADTFNDRVLIWNDAPTGNVPPDVVVGQPDLRSNRPGSGRHELNWPMSVASDGTRLVVTDTNNHRILIWNSIPTVNGAPADLVLGGPGARPDRRGALVWPWGVWTDGVRLVVSSTGASAVLIWTRFPTRDGDAPDLVLTGGGRLGTPRQITSDGRSLMVGDHNARVPGSPATGAFVWSTFPTRDDVPYDLYLSGGAPWPRGTFGPDGSLWLMDRTLSRWDRVPTSAAAVADLVLDRSPCAGSGDYENVLAVGSRLFVSCGNDNKVVMFNAIPARAGARPDFALGAPDLDTNTLHTRYIVQNGVPASNGTSLFVASDFDRKLYVWRALPDRSGAYPDVVYTFDDAAPWAIALWGDTLAVAGKDAVHVWKKLPLQGELPDLTFRGRIGDVHLQDLRGVALDAKYFYLADAAADAVHVWEGLPADGARPKYTLRIAAPRRLHSDGEHLVVTATFEHSIQVFQIGSLSSVASAIRVGGVGRLNLPEAAIASHGQLVVADTSNNRVLVWRDLTRALAGQWPPDAVLGQPDLAGHGAAIGRERLFMPGALAFDASYLWVGEFKFSDRIVRFSALP